MEVRQGKKWSIVDRTFEFGVSVAQLCLKLDRHPGTVRRLSGQLFDAATSIGSNVEEGQAAQSRADFISKYKIALKEAREARYWLRMLIATNVAQPRAVEDLMREAGELAAILGKSMVTAGQAKGTTDKRRSRNDGEGISQGIGKTFESMATTTQGDGIGM